TSIHVRSTDATCLMSPPTLSWPAVGVARACSSVRPNAARRRTSRCWARYESSASRSSTTGRTFPGIRRSLQLERRPVGHPREEVEATVARYVAARERIDAGNGTWADLVPFFTDDVVFVDPAWGR